MTTPVNGYSNTDYTPSTSSVRTQLSAEEKKYLQELVSIPLYSILASKELYCKKLGQEIFNQAKATHNGDTSKARDAVARIYNAISSRCNNAPLRMDYVEICLERNR